MSRVEEKTLGPSPPPTPPDTCFFCRTRVLENTAAVRCPSTCNLGNCKRRLVHLECWVASFKKRGKRVSCPNKQCGVNYFASEPSCTKMCFKNWRRSPSPSPPPMDTPRPGTPFPKRGRVWSREVTESKQPMEAEDFPRLLIEVQEEEEEKEEKKQPSKKRKRERSLSPDLDFDFIYTQPNPNMLADYSKRK